MDRRFKAAFVIAGTLGLGLPWLPLSAQEEQPPPVVDRSHDFGTSELPKGLTIVPWKIGPPGESSARRQHSFDSPAGGPEPRREHTEQSSQN